MAFDVGEAANREIVDDPDPTPGGEKRIDEMAADESGPAGHEVQAVSTIRRHPLRSPKSAGKLGPIRLIAG
ncbi:hypothetical protein TMPK1_36870 [Rhodospirillales bacterium TMPK1]|uniref:Uncharacterized protein n=1 Tax=Roseiterribacter gracilis TaxID=2812848 RepID=A0A8S8XKU8_9PROT|nr:hypothetical protein TMPK1_36870 [Rhodospirillales bacterium TMPK1]